MGRNVTDMGSLEESKRELKKHAASIHCSNTLSLLQRKISNALLYHAYKELLQKEEHDITVKQLCRLIGYQGHNHAAIKEALKGLISTVVEWNLIDDKTGEENWTASTMIASVSLQGPLCYYAYSPRMKQLLHSPSMFGKIDLVIQSRFRSSYGLALYENCIRYAGLPHTKWFEMAVFKKLMGVPAGIYEIFRDFKRRVLDKAVEEVNTYSDLVVEPDYFREGRKVIRVRFMLKDRAKKSRLGKAELSASDANNGVLEAKLLTQYGLSEDQIKQLFLDHTPAFIIEKINVIESSQPYQAGKVQNLAGYLLSAVKNNYQPPKDQKQAPIKLENNKKEMELERLKHQAEQIRNDYHCYREELVENSISALNEKDKAEFMARFYEFSEPAITTILALQRHRYNAETVMESPQMQALLRKFAWRELDLSSASSIDEFVKTMPEEKQQIWDKLKSHEITKGMMDEEIGGCR